MVPQLYTTIRNNKLLTRERLQQLWDSNDIIKSTLYSTDPKYISQCIINELSIIIETLSPSKLIQCEKKYAPWIDNEFLEQSSIRDKLQSIAVSTNLPDD